MPNINDDIKSMYISNSDQAKAFLAMLYKTPDGQPDQPKIDETIAQFDSEIKADKSKGIIENIKLGLVNTCIACANDVKAKLVELGYWTDIQDLSSFKISLYKAMVEEDQDVTTQDGVTTKTKVQVPKIKYDISVTHRDGQESKKASTRSSGESNKKTPAPKGFETWQAVVDQFENWASQNSQYNGHTVALSLQKKGYLDESFKITDKGTQFDVSYVKETTLGKYGFNITK